MTMPPKYVPVKTCPPKRVVGLDGVTRIIVYDCEGAVVSKQVLDVPLVSITRSFIPPRSALRMPGAT